MTSRIGRFEIRSELGRGAQSIVYLAFDPHLQREVAIKTMHFGADDASPSKRQLAENARLMAEARTVSKLRHANIVPIFEAGEEGNDPYLVFEYVAGRDLGQLLRAEGALSPPAAAELMVAVLGALAQAHQHGIIHRDLKPSNILIDASGLPRVMDFGISVGVSDDQLIEAQAGLLGTPAYMAPEYVRERAVGVGSDIYAAGLVLLEMLTGRRAVEGDSAREVLARVAGVVLTLPEDVSIDERLGSIILKACAPDPEARYASAGTMRQALSAYLEPGGRGDDSPAESGGEAGKPSTLEFLLRRMRHKTDFPALSDSVAAINRLTASEKESVNRLSNAILKDFGLTNKILRLVNSAYYRQAGGGTISTVSRAAVVLGFNAIRNIAITVLLFEHLQNKGNASQLKEAFLRANFSGLLARDMSAKTMPRESEEAFICALFHGLGRLLAQYYFPEEMEEVLKVMQQKQCSDEAAAAKVLGIGFEDLGIGIARNWGFPRAIVASMRRLPEGPVRKPDTREETLHVMTGFANELCDAIAGAPTEDRRKVMMRVGERYSPSLQFSDQQLQETLEKSLGELTQVAAILRVNLKQSPFVRQIKSWSEGGQSPEAAADAGSLDGTVILGAGAIPEATEAALAEEPGQVRGDAQTILAAGIQDISNSLVEDASLNDILRITLETMYRAMGFSRVLLCLRDTKSNRMVGRFGFGVDAGEVVRDFHFSLGFAPDVFHAAISKGLDIFISDVNDPKIQARIPEWYTRHVPAQTFVLFPLSIKGKAVALIYCDRDRAGEIDIPEKELSLLKTLRNQALLAIKQSV
ncbi:serine/threonine-protein kinase PrkC [mine drainage metagenome]|uniref:Serine/threonine-protein kinase PrkC n=1 Tax=mine drainage metagenome TaxID=410659 RepID=A0A1J5RDV1_9ZZZZ